MGEIDPDVAVSFGLTQTTGAGTPARRIGWLEVDLGLLFDEDVVARRAMVAAAVSRFPSSDIDLALVVDDAVPADVVAEVLGRRGRRPARVGGALRRLPGPGHRRGQAQPGLPACASARSTTP